MLGGYSRVISAQSWRFVPADVGLHRGSDRKRFADCLLPVRRTTLTRILMSDRKFRIGIRAGSQVWIFGSCSFSNAGHNSIGSWSARRVGYILESPRYDRECFLVIVKNSVCGDGSETIAVSVLQLRKPGSAHILADELHLAEGGGGIRCAR